MEEHKIGEIYAPKNGTKIQVVDASGIAAYTRCMQCKFHDFGIFNLCGLCEDIESCSGCYRKDGKNVYFKDVRSKEEILEWEKRFDEMKKNVKDLSDNQSSNSIKKLPTSWKEFCETTPIKNRECWITDLSRIAKESKLDDKKRDIVNDKNLLPNKESAKAHLALMQLEQLRDSYRQGWEPNYDDFFKTKYDIVVDGHSITKSQHVTGQRFLSFQTEELRNMFYDNFNDLIEIAKKLI